MGVVGIAWALDAVTGAPSYTGRALRQTQSPGLAGATAARPFGAISGVRPGTSAATVTATSNTWTAQTFAGVIDLEASALSGAYEFAFNLVTSGAVTASNASNPRSDILSVRIDDPAEGDGTSVPAATLVYTAGVAAGSPVAPATPARSFIIAQFNFTAGVGTTPSVTWVAPYTVAAGGILPVTSLANLTAYTPNDGALAVRTDTGIPYLRASTAWRPLSGARIYPTGVAGAGVSIATDGTIILAGASTITLLGIGSADYDTIHVEFDGVGTAAANMICRVRASGTDVSTSTYAFVNVETTTSTGPNRAATSPDTSVTMFRVDVGQGSGSMDISGLFAAQATTFRYRSFDASVTDRYGSGRNSNITSYTDITLILGSGTVTGTLKLTGSN